MYYDPYDYGLESSISNSSGPLVALTIVALIAAIVVAVVFYKRYVGQPQDVKTDLKDKSTWGPFFRFDRLIIYNVLCALYLFCAAFALFEAVAIILAAIADGFAAFIISLILMAIVCFVIELVLRVSFESTMLLVRVTQNTSSIKELLGGHGANPFVGGPAPAAPVPPAPAPQQAPAPQPAPAPAPAPAPQPAPVPVPAPQPAPAPQAAEQPAPAPVAEPAPEPGPAPTPAPTPEEAPAPQPAAAPAAKVCPACGATAEPGDAFCRQCGAKL